MSPKIDLELGEKKGLFEFEILKDEDEERREGSANCRRVLQYQYNYHCTVKYFLLYYFSRRVQEVSAGSRLSTHCNCTPSQVDHQEFQRIICGADNQCLSAPQIIR